MVALAGAAGLRASGEDPIDAGEYVFTLFLSAVWVWPLYMAALYALGRRGRFRVWALAALPAARGRHEHRATSRSRCPRCRPPTLACVLFALAVRPPRRVGPAQGPCGDGTRSRREVEPAASCPPPRAGRLPVAAMLRSDRGQTAAEYMGMLLVVSLVVAALATSSVATDLSAAVSDARLRDRRRGVRDGGGSDADARRRSRSPAGWPRSRRSSTRPAARWRS